MKRCRESAHIEQGKTCADSERRIMQCYTPMVRFYNIVPKEAKNTDEKHVQRIIPRSEVFANLQENENYLSRIQDKNEELEKQGSLWRYELIPCRHCWACQLKYAAEWATRLTWESQYHKHKYYITLTYNEENLPIYAKFKYISPEGENIIYENDGTWTGTLEPNDVTKFINTLRKYYERRGIKGIKYFYCGEYGSEGKRPHYHMILFGAPLDLNQFYSYKLDNKHHKMHWKSKELERWWGKGIVDVAEVEWNSCAYVARYCMKKIDNNNDPKEYAAQGKIKEFIRMSRNPGIATRYYQENKDKIYELDEVIQRTIHGNVSSFKPPAAFDKKLKEEDPELYEQIKESRRAAAERNRKLEKELYKGITDKERLKRQAEKVILKGDLLKRTLED